MDQPINLYHSCDECDDSFPISTPLIFLQDLRLCATCYAHLTVCESCGRRIAHNHRVYFLVSTHLCKRCFKATLLEEAVIEDLSWVPGADYGYAPKVKRLREDA